MATYVGGTYANNSANFNLDLTNIAGLAVGVIDRVMIELEQEGFGG